MNDLLDFFYHRPTYFLSVPREMRKSKRNKLNTLVTKNMLMNLMDISSIMYNYKLGMMRSFAVMDPDLDRIEICFGWRINLNMVH